MRFVTSLMKTLPLNFVLLCPAGSDIPDSFREVDSNPRRHGRLLHSLQRLRGAAYLSDGAIQSWQLTRDGRHEQSMDFEGWHLLGLDARSNVCGCVRYRHYPNTVAFHQLGVYDTIFATRPDWGKMLRLGIERELIAARRRGMAYAEVGGWAIAPERRNSPEALRLALATYAVAELLGGALGITTATVRHHSASILRRLGGKSLMAGGLELPSYFDCRYNCEMEVLQFDSRSPSPAYESLVDELRARMSQVTVVCGDKVAEESVRWVRQPVHASAARAWTPA